MTSNSSLTDDIEAAIEAVEYERRTGVPMKPEFWDTVIAAARRWQDFDKGFVQRAYHEEMLDAEREQRQQLFESAAGWSAEAIKQEKRAEQAEATVREQDALINDLYNGRDLYAARVSKLEAALREISAELACERPCSKTKSYVCYQCGAYHGGIWCAGCIARWALQEHKK